MGAKRKKDKGKGKAKAIRRARVIESFAVAEQIREEKDSGKLFLIGLYGGNQVLLKGDLPSDLTENPVHVQLSFWIQYTHTGETEALLWMNNPQGSRILEQSLVLAPMDQESPAHSIYLTGGMLSINMLGRYEVGLDYDGKRDSRFVTIKHRPD